MEYQPKHAEEQAKKKKKGIALVALAVGALAVTAGGVFAANSITINGDDKIEFGQGVATTSACDASMTSNLTQAWSQDAGYFVVDTLTIGYDAEVCNGKTITVSTLDSTGAAICGIDNQTHDITNNTDSSFTLSASSCDASEVKRVALTTSKTN